ncbi:MAG: flagellar basal-body MS-ring/collar protein FliF [Alphaproteobacteria bacterium]|nr:flagellar basal-body MS-ring/collar protein FliF [Alphaproteobacteria bacterium]
MNSLIQTLRNLGPMRIAVIAAIGVAVLGLVLYVVIRMNSSDWSLLYSNLEVQDASSIDQRLTQMNIPHTLSSDNTQIFVNREDVSKARLSLATEGLPSGGSVGYEIFDKSQGLATSSFVQNINQLRALEGEMARTITGIDGVATARVHLVLPQRELFTREKQEPSASILIRMKGPKRLTREQVGAITHIVATAVPDLKPGRISIADERGTLLARGEGAGEAGFAGREEAENNRAAYEDRLARAVETMLEQSLGQGRVRADVNATIDYNRVTQSDELYNPDQQVVRSTATVSDVQEQSSTDNNSSVTIANNLPQGQGQNLGGGSGDTSRSNRQEETTNFEISKTIRNQVREPGTISRVTISVLVDGSYTTGADGAKVYVPRSATELDQIENLVKGVVGFDSNRGDTVQVVNMPFSTETLEEPSTPKLFGFERDEVIKIAEAAVLGVVAILVLFLVVRPLLGQLFESSPQAATAAGAAAALLPPGMAMADGQRLLAGPGSMATLTSDGELAGLLSDGSGATSMDDLIDLSQIDGRVKASSLRRIGEMVERNPEDVVSIIRNWLYQEQ